MMHVHGLWRSLDESDPSHVDHGHAAVATLSRREFLKFAAAAAAVSGAGCRAPVEEIVPAVHPDRALPGVPMVFATAMALGGSATGLLVESNAGRPTKIEGNPGHPSSLGATDGFAQAAILDLWNPERSKVVRRRGRIEARSALESGLRDALANLGEGGEGLRILSGYTSSPTLVGQMRSLASRYPGMRWHFWEALHRDQSLEGARLAFGRAVEPVYKPENADVVLALDADLVGDGPGHLRYAREIASRRRPSARGPMSRVYAVETTPTLTGAFADRRLALAPADIEAWLAELAAALYGDAGGVDSGPRGEAAREMSPIAIASELRRRGGRALIVAGESLSPPAHALVHSLNAQLRAPGHTVAYIEPVTGDVRCGDSLRELVEDLRGGRVRML